MNASGPGDEQCLCLQERSSRHLEWNDLTTERQDDQPHDDQYQQEVDQGVTLISGTGRVVLSSACIATSRMPGA
jgi:hypothetical protein